MQGDAAARLQGLHATTDHMRNVLKSIQPERQLEPAKPVMFSSQLKQPSTRPALLPIPPARAQPSTSNAALQTNNAQPSTSKASNYTDLQKGVQLGPPTQYTCHDRKRDAEGRLRKENNQQAGVAAATMPVTPAEIVLHVYQQKSKMLSCLGTEEY